MGDNACERTPTICGGGGPKLFTVGLLMTPPAEAALHWAPAAHCCVGTDCGAVSRAPFKSTGESFPVFIPWSNPSIPPPRIVTGDLSPVRTAVIPLLGLVSTI